MFLALFMSNTSKQFETEIGCKQVADGCKLFGFYFELQEDAKADAMDAFYNDIINKELLLNVEYKVLGCEYVTLMYLNTKDDLAQSLISAGWVLAERRREKRLSKMVTDYQKAQEKAKSARVSFHNYIKLYTLKMGICCVLSCLSFCLLFN